MANSSTEYQDEFGLKVYKRCSVDEKSHAGEIGCPSHLQKVGGPLHVAKQEQEMERIRRSLPACASACSTEEQPQVTLCSKNQSRQIGNSVHVPHKEPELGRVHQRLPACDEDFIAQVYNEADRGTHRVEPGWRDPRWSDPMRPNDYILYEPAQRDPPNRSNFYVYRSTITDPMTTPCHPLTAPDIHKLRYMQNSYTAPDDWYD